MHRLNLIAAGSALLLTLVLLVVSCQSLLFGRVARAEPECQSEPEYDRVAGAFLQHARQQVRGSPLVHDPAIDAEMLERACAVLGDEKHGVTDYRTFLNSMISSERFWQSIGHPAACRYGSAHVLRDDGSLIAFVRFTGCESGGVSL